jgi:hypothetical protein
MNDDETMDAPADDGDELCDQQRWIDELLRSKEASELESASSDMHVALAMAIGKRRRRAVVRRSLAVAAAASLAIAAAWQYRAAPRAVAPGFARGSNHQAVLHHEATPWQSQPLQQAMFVTDGSAIAVPLTSDDAQVSIVQVYPTTTTQRRWRRELSLFAGPTGQDGG